MKDISDIIKCSLKSIVTQDNDVQITISISNTGEIPFDIPNTALLDIVKRGALTLTSTNRLTYSCHTLDQNFDNFFQLVPQNSIDKTHFISDLCRVFIPLSPGIYTLSFNRITVVHPHKKIAEDSDFIKTYFTHLTCSTVFNIPALESQDLQMLHGGAEHLSDF